MRKCKHTRDGVDLFIRKRADGEDWDPMTPTCDQGPPIAWRCCRCGEYASLGPARDDDERVQTELYALEMLVWAGDIGSKSRREILNSGDICGAGCIYCEGSYLACAIAEHPTGADQ